MRIQIKRKSHNPDAEYNRIDTKFCNGSIPEIPHVGDTMVVQFDRLGWGVWRTTPVTAIKIAKNGFEVDTKNSTYFFKFGWKEE